MDCQTHIHSVTRDTEGGWNLGKGSDTISTHVGVANPPIQLMGYEHREDAVGGGGSMQCQTHTHKRTHSVPRDTQGGGNLGQGSEPILTHVSVALPLIKLKGSELLDAQWGAESAGSVKHTHTNAHTVSHLIHRIDKASSMYRTQS